MARAKTDAERIQAALDDIVRFTLSLPDVIESTSYGQPALKRGDKLLFALRKDLTTLALACGFEERAALMRNHPDTFFITDHYLNWPSVVVRLVSAKPAIVRRAVEASWERAGPRSAKTRASDRPTARRR